MSVHLPESGDERGHRRGCRRPTGSRIFAVHGITLLRPSTTEASEGSHVWRQPRRGRDILHATYTTPAPRCRSIWALTDGAGACCRRVWAVSLVRKCMHRAALLDSGAPRSTLMSAVLALKSFTNSMIFRPACPRAAPTGGPGLACPALITSLIT